MRPRPRVPRPRRRSRSQATRESSNWNIQHWSATKMEAKPCFLKRFSVFLGAKSIVPRLLKDFGMGIFLMIVLITLFWCLIRYSVWRWLRRSIWIRCRCHSMTLCCRFAAAPLFWQSRLKIHITFQLKDSWQVFIAHKPTIQLENIMITISYYYYTIIIHHFFFGVCLNTAGPRGWK